MDKVRREKEKSTKDPRLLVHFRDDTVTTVSRGTLSHIAKVLGFSETQTVNYAIARLRDELREGSGGGDDYPPLTAQQLIAIRKHARKPTGKLVKKSGLF